MGGEVVALIVAAVLGAGGLGALLRARPEAEKAQAESFATSVGAQSTVIGNLQSENRRLSDENEQQRATIKTLELRLDVLEGEMRVIKGQVNGG